MKLNILSISYAKRILDPDSRERARAQQYAAELEQYIIVVFTRENEGYPDVQKIGNLTLYATNSLSKFGMLARAYRIGREVLALYPKEQFVISSQDPFESCLIARLLLPGTLHKHQVQIHGDVFNPASSHSSLLQRVRIFYGRRIIKHADRVRVVSDRIKRSVLSLGVPEDRMVVLPIFADLKELLALGAKRLRSQSPAVDRPLQILYVGRLSPEKNLGLLLSACARFKKSDSAFSLRVVGDGPEKNILQNLAARLDIQNNVEFVDWTNDIASELSRADVFCLTSNHEGWGMVLQEAAAAGVPIVTTDVGCVGELLYDDVSALVVPVDDLDALVKALGRMTDFELRQSLSKQAYVKVAKTALEENLYIKNWVASHE